MNRQRSGRAAGADSGCYIVVYLRRDALELHTDSNDSDNAAVGKIGSAVTIIIIRMEYKYWSVF
ncbi:hypothetical protein [Robinsoniella sp. KNHs210]|uniref:hypothetical protein n=1 Tax=Robinsoniella sp. KNHs210 TaxID=1469950 RepID=UPI0012DBD048|nr:hypothetical protein [Robinsoniella sp. KNHs210]